MLLHQRERALHCLAFVSSKSWAETSEIACTRHNGGQKLGVKCTLSLLVCCRLVFMHFEYTWSILNVASLFHRGFTSGVQCRSLTSLWNNSFSATCSEDYLYCVQHVSASGSSVPRFLVTQLLRFCPLCSLAELNVQFTHRFRNKIS